MSFTDAALVAFEALTRRTFLVIDTEYEPTASGNHLISIGIVPLLRGKKAPASGELYLEMNPGVPIAPETTAIHGFTDASVARKKPFSHHAPAILAYLAEHPDAVVVSHTGVDVHLLRSELDRAQQTGALIGLDDLPDLPLIDTSLLPSQLRLPFAAGRSVVSLAALTRSVEVSNSDPHHARSDARATAQALIKLLLHAAKSGTWQDIDELLTAHARGTLAAPRIGTAGVVAPRQMAPQLPPEHLASHAHPITERATAAQLKEWLNTAADCVRLCCPHLDNSAALAARENGREVLAGMTKLAKGCTEPGQAGTLLGGLIAILDLAAPTQPALPSGRAMKWDKTLMAHLREAPRCHDQAQCPSCRDGNGCPMDTIYQSIARIAALGPTGELTKQRIDNILIGRTENGAGNRAITDWTNEHAKAYMVWLVLLWEERHRPVRAADHLKWAVNKGLHRVEPRLALMECRTQYARGHRDEARELAGEVLARATTDPAFAELRDWLTNADAHAEALERRSRRRVITHPKLARPAGRTNANPYAVKR